MDPEACWADIVCSMKALCTTPANDHLRLPTDDLIAREKLAEMLDSLAGWIRKGGFVPTPEEWR